MSRNLKVLGLALAAAMALTAVMASAASAVTHDPAKFTTTNGATMTAGQKTQHKFTVTGQTVTCNTATFDGVAPGASFAEVAVTATYADCKSEPLGVSASVTGFGTEVGQENKCWYVLKASGGAELKCDGTGEVTVTAATCQVHVPAQSFASGLTYSNGKTKVGEKEVADVTVAFEVKGIKGNHTDGFLCPFSSGGNSETGVLEGESTVTATVEGAAVDGSHDATVNTP